MKNDRLEIGDRVRVNCNTGQITILYNAEILYIPKATGESWIFKPLDITYKPSGGLVYVRMMCWFISCFIRTRVWVSRHKHVHERLRYRI